MSQQNDILVDAKLPQPIDVFKAVHEKPGAASQCLDDLLMSIHLLVVF